MCYSLGLLVSRSLTMKIKVLFLCATNSVQSPMAEALLRRIGSEHFEVASAGIECEPIHPLTIEVMREIGIDLEGQSARRVNDIVSQNFDLVITVCDRAKYRCPSFTNAEHIHWQFDDPATSPNLQRRRQMFQTLRDQIAQRINLFVLVQVRFKTVGVSAVNETPQSSNSAAQQARAQSAGIPK
jgi:arsenate reductase (thioredoxin)